MIPGIMKDVELNRDGRTGSSLVSDRSDELFVGTERGMHKVRTLRRQEATERVDFDFSEHLRQRGHGSFPRVRKKSGLCCWM